MSEKRVSEETAREVARALVSMEAKAGGLPYCFGMADKRITSDCESCPHRKPCHRITYEALREE